MTNATIKAASTVKTTTAKATKAAKQADQLADLKAFFANKASEREQLAAKLSTAQRTDADFNAVQLAATQQKYYTFAGTVSDVLKHAKSPERAMRNNFGKLAFLCYILNGETVTKAETSAKHKASTTRDAAGVPYNPQLKQTGAACAFILEALKAGKNVDAKDLQKHLAHDSTTQASEWLKAFDYAGCGSWKSPTLTANGDAKKIATLCKAFNI